MNFFENYLDFLSTTKVGNDLNRLNYRYKNIIDTIDYKDKTVLDLGSHDGRWAFAAVHAGAKSVVGVEYNQDLVIKAQKIKSKYNFNNTSFICSDNIDFLKKNKQTFDIILCCGVFYHTLNHLEYFKYMTLFVNEYIVLDTQIWPSMDPMVHISLESSKWDGNGFSNIPNDQNSKDTIVGIPSQKYIEILADSFNLSIKKIDKTESITNQHKLVDYVSRNRFTYLLKK